MAGNFFDQFDSAPAAPQQAPTGNAFDKFDSIPNMPPEKYDFETTDAAPPANGSFTPMDNRAAAGPAAIGNYLKGWGGRVYDSVVNPDLHEGEDLGTGFMSTIASPVDVALTLGTGAISPLTGWAHALDERANEDPGYSVAQGIQDRTWTPRTDVGARFADQLGAVFKPVSDLFGAGGEVLGENVGRMGGSPQFQQDVSEGALPALATAFGVKAGGSALAKRSAERSPGSAIGFGNSGNFIARMRANGFMVTPDMAATKYELEQPGPVHEFRPGQPTESFLNQNRLDNKVAIANTKNIRGLLADEFGVADANPETLQAVSDSLNPAYDYVAKALPVFEHTKSVQNALNQLGSERNANVYLKNRPEVDALRQELSTIDRAPTQHALDAIRQWREDARHLFQSSTDRVAGQALARVYRQAANALEDGIQAQLDANDNLHIADQWRKARETKAKIHNVLDAWNEGDLDPQALAHIESSDGVTMTGNLAKITEAARNMPSIVKSPTPITIGLPEGSGVHTSGVAESAIRRLLFDRWGIQNLMGDKFQNQFGLPAPRSPNTIAPPELPYGDPPVSPPPPPPSPPSFDELLRGAKGQEAVPWNSDASTLFTELGGPAESPRTMPSDLPTNQNLADLAPPRPPLPTRPEPGAVGELLDQNFGGALGPETVPMTPPGGPSSVAPIANELGAQLPAGLGEMLQQTPAPIVDLIGKLLTHPLGDLASELGLSGEPAVPWNAPRGSRGLRGQREELSTPTGVAAPEEFPDMLPPIFKPRR